MQLLYFRRHNNSATAAENADIVGAALTQQVDRVFEVFDMPALVGADGNAMHILLQRRCDNFLHRAVVPEMDHFSTAGLQHAANDVDRCVVSVKQAGSRYEADSLGRTMFGGGGLVA